MAKGEVIIVGAGPAGCAAAWDLLDQGFNVKLLDKSLFPRFKPCAGGLTPKALYLFRYSIAPVIREASSDLTIAYKGKSHKCLSANNPVCAFTVRSELDQYCFEQTLLKGAAFQQIEGIRALHEEGQKVTLELKDGQCISGDYLIGADGAHSRIRKLTQQFKPNGTAVALEGIVRRDAIRLPPKGQLPSFTFDFGVVDHGYSWIFPKGDHFNVGLYTRFPDRAGTLSKQTLMSYVQQALGTDQIEHVCGFPIGTGGEDYRPSHERIFLVGDAAGMAEPLLGEGLHNAIKSGQSAARAIIKSGKSLTARDLFQQEIRVVSRDVYNCRRVASFFYPLVPAAFRIVKYPPVSTIAMHGFAAGLTVTECKRAFFSGRLRPRRESALSLRQSNT